jgi:hypothetical protein
VRGVCVSVRACVGVRMGAAVQEGRILLPYLVLLVDQLLLNGLVHLCKHGTRHGLCQ